MKVLASNKKAYFDYEIVETFVAGIKLEGREIKSLRNQKPNFAGSFVTIQQGNPILSDLNIPRYAYDSTADYDPKRKRLLLLKKTEIERIEGKLSGEGVTLIPLEIGLERQWAKVTIGLARGKKQYDKRRTTKEREEKRTIDRVMKSRR
jgi:SsrA-binding protein